MAYWVLAPRGSGRDKRTWEGHQLDPYVILAVQPTQAQSGMTPAPKESDMRGEVWQEHLQAVVTQTVRSVEAPWSFWSATECQSSGSHGQGGRG